MAVVSKGSRRTRSETEPNEWPAPETILVPLDGTRFANRALPVAAVAARELGAGVELVSAQWVHGQEETERALRKAASKVGLGDVSIVVTSDRLAFSAVKVAADEARAPLICMATHARSGFGQSMLGSAAEDILRRGQWPLLLVGRNVDVAAISSFEHVLVCIDGSPMSIAALPLAATFQHLLGAQVSLVKVIPPSPGLSEDGAAAEIDWLTRLAEEQGLRDPSVELPNAGFHLLESATPARAIADLAKRTANPLVVVATHGRGGAARVTMGSVAIEIVRRAPCPVLTFRPPGLSNE